MNGNQKKKQTQKKKKSENRSENFRKTVDTVNKVANTAKAVGEAIQIAKGVFNHPDWYKYDGQLVKPAINDKRPVTPKALGRSVPNNTMGGIATLSRLNFVYVDISESEAFKLATANVFQSLRAQLKTNLVETLDDVRNYLAQVMEISVRVKSIERNLAYQFYNDPNSPDIRKLMATVVNNPMDYGSAATSVLLSYISQDGDLASSEGSATQLFWIKKINSALEGIPMPKKYIDLCSWLFGSVFIDQKAYNKQYYVNDLRKMRKHTIKYSTSGSYVIAERVLENSNYDPTVSDTLEGLYQDILNVKTAYGILIADLSKFAGWQTLTLVPYSNYQFKLLNDYEYFSILDNAYTCAPVPAGQVNNDISFRIDVAESLSDENITGVMNAVAYISTLPKGTSVLAQYFNKPDSRYTDYHEYDCIAPFIPVSQSVSMSVDPDTNVPAALNLAGFKSQDYTAITKTEGNVYIINNPGYLDHLVGVDTKSSSTSQPKSIKADSSNRAVVADRGQITDMQIFVNDGFAATMKIEHVRELADRSVQTYPLMSLSDGTEFGIKFELVREDNKISTETPGYYIRRPGSTVMPVTANYAEPIIEVQQYFMNQALIKVSFSMCAVGAENNPTVLDAIARMVCKQIGDSFSGPLSSVTQIGFNITISDPEVNTSYQLSENLSLEMISYAFSCVDHHIPFVHYTAYRITNTYTTDSGTGSFTVRTQGQAVLNKPAYKSLMVRTDDIRSVVYWMYMGLFNLDISRN